MKAIISVLAALMFSAATMAPQQHRLINGLVSDEAGKPLAGVSVVEEGTPNGTLTDMKGSYQIYVAPEASRLVFSLTGYETRKVRIGNASQLNVRLNASSPAPEEVLVVSDALEYESSPTPGVAVVPHRGGVNRSYEKKAMYHPAYSPEPGYVQHNTEGYSAIHENGFKDVLHNPLSTFSIDVDKASYSNVRRFLNMGQLPPMDAVRIEEMINYFYYDYPEPEGKHPFSVYTEISNCPWNGSHQLLHVGLKGKSIDKSELPASNLVFLHRCVRFHECRQ